MADLSVLVVLVASNGSAWLRQTIASIQAQTYSSIDVVAVDNASTDRSRAALERAFGKANVVKLDRRVGYGRALAAGLTAAGQRATKAGAFLFLHDDCALEPDAVEHLVDALGFEGVGIAGPKLVEWDAPETLQEVGLSVDRYGRMWDPLEPGELDQGQYDKVRETMWVSSAAMLVVRDVVERAGFFDPRFVVLREDLDLCWRARLAGYKVAFAGTARARHAAASLRQTRDGFARGRTAYFAERNMLASLIKNSSRTRLLWLVPSSVLLSLGRVVVALVSGRRSEAAQVLEALRWNLAHLPSTIQYRAKAQRARRVPDAEIMRFSAKGAHRARSMFERAFERIAGDPAQGVEEAEGFATPGQRTKMRMRDRIRAHPGGFAALVIVIAYAAGWRTLFHGGGLSGADMPPFPGSPSALLRGFFSSWRTAGTGGGAPAPAAGFVAGTLSVLAFGSTWLAQRLLVAAMIPIAGLTASRLASRLGCGVGSRRVAAFTYALSPLALWASGTGRLSDMVLIAAAPGLCIPFVRAAGVAPSNGWRDLVAPLIGAALATAFAPWTLVFVAGAGFFFAAGAFAAGRGDRAVRCVTTGLILGGAVVLVLFPWSIELFRSGSALGLGGALPHAGAEDLVRLSPAGLHAVPLVLATVLPVAAAAGFALSPGALSRGTRAIAVAGVLGLGAAFAVARGVPWIAPRSSLPLVLFAVAVATVIGLGAEGIAPSLRGRAFGLTQVGLFVLTLAMVAAVGAGGVWVVRGTRPGLTDAGALAPAFLAADRSAYGDYRLLWVAGSATTVHAALTGATGDTMVNYAERRAGAGQDVLDGIVAGVATQRIDAAGRQLAQFGVRYVFVRPEATGDLFVAFARQADLRFVQRFEGSAVFANDAWLPNAVAVKAGGWIAASSAGANDAESKIAAAEQNPQAGPGFRARANDWYSGTIPAGFKRVLLATAFDGGWRLQGVGANVPPPVKPQRSFGWATAFDANATGNVVIAWQGQTLYKIELLIQLAILLGFAVVWSRRVAHERGEI